MVDTQEPVRAPVGAEVLVRIRAAGVCHSDVMLYDGFVDTGAGRKIDLRRGVAAPRVLGPGVGSEDGLQVKTVLAKRSVNALFPVVSTIVGVRPDAKPWHPSGRAIDVMIPNHSSRSGRSSFLPLLSAPRCIAKSGR